MNLSLLNWMDGMQDCPVEAKQRIHTLEERNQVLQREKQHLKKILSDFDLDGNIDFIVGDNCGLVKLFKNNGAGSFTDEGVI